MAEAGEAMEADEKEAETLQSELMTIKATPTQECSSFDFEREWDNINMRFSRHERSLDNTKYTPCHW
jgi:hypothetical protein